MSTRIVDGSVKKPESVKSSKDVVNTGGYELVGPAKGKKSPSSSGYLKPDARAVGGYELVRIPAGKKTGAIQNTEISYVRPMDQKVEQSKRDPVLIVAVLVLTIFGIVAIITIGVIFFAVDDEPLPDLNELCRNEQDPPDDFPRDCFHHKHKYTTGNCTRSECNLAAYTIDFGPHGMGGIDFYSSSKLVFRDLSEIPDRTPCAPGKWCQNGKCVETNDVRVKRYDEIKPTNGVWVNSCGKRSRCLTVKRKHLKYIKSFGECMAKNECQHSAQSVAFGYRYCSPPDHGGYDCDKNEEAVYVIKTCPQKLSESIINPTSEIKCNDYPKFNCVPCKTRELSGFCFKGVCIPYSTDDQNCNVTGG